MFSFTTFHSVITVLFHSSLTGTIRYRLR